MRHRLNKRIVDPKILKEIRRLRLEVCPNMGKAKVKKNLDIYCQKNNLPIYSESKIGRIIKDKKIYHDGTIKIIIKSSNKRRKPKEFKANSPGEL